MLLNLVRQCCNTIKSCIQSIFGYQQPIQPNNDIVNRLNQLSAYTTFDAQRFKLENQERNEHLNRILNNHSRISENTFNPEISRLIQKIQNRL